MFGRIIYTPPKVDKRRYRYVVAGRLAWLYSDGTLLRTRRNLWRCTHDRVYDSFPWWEPMSLDTDTV